MDWAVGCRLGRDKTIEMVSSNNINDEIRKFVMHCEQCQKMDANFPKSNSKLHPIVPVPNVQNVATHPTRQWLHVTGPCDVL